VLIKARDLLTLGVFEFETVRYDPELYLWGWNENDNLEGFEKATNIHCFTWQPHGSQFTIIEPVPNDCLLVKLKMPDKLDKDAVLKAIGFEDNWITVTKRAA